MAQDPDRLDFSDYQRFVEGAWFGEAALGERSLRDVAIVGCGLVGECCEVVEKLKKHVRDGSVDVDALALELGDVLYYATAIASMYQLRLERVAAANVLKLLDRRRRGASRGEGDDR